MALRLGLLRVSFGELLDPGHHARGRDAQQLGGAVHRQPAQVEQHRRDLDPQRHAARRGVGEVEPAGLAAVALQPLHESVLDVPLSPAPLAPQPHRPAPPAVPPPTDIGDLRCLKILLQFFAWTTIYIPKTSETFGTMLQKKRKSFRTVPKETSFPFGKFPNVLPRTHLQCVRL